MAKKINWEKKADAEYSRVVRQVGKCEMCNREGKRGKKQGWTNLDAHHIIFRTHKEYRHDLSNGLCLCVPCHQWSIISPHQDQHRFFEWLERNRPGQYLWYLENTLPVEKSIIGIIIITRVTIKRSRELTNRQAYEMLKEM